MKNLTQEQFRALLQSNPLLAANLIQQLQAEKLTLSKKLAALEYEKYLIEKQFKADFTLRESTPASHPARDWPTQSKESP